MATYAMPKVALLPVLAVWLGFDDRARVIVIFLVCVYPVYLAAHHGAREVEPQLMWVARNCAAPRVETFTRIVVPAALPRLLPGVRIAAALSVVMCFAVEIVGLPTGLGSLIYRSYLAGQYPRMYAGIATLGALGALADRVFARLARRLTRGQQLEAIGAP
jgi:ABC-type nitrate/sulfonate/bicarbonate transport system permease component